MRNDLDYFYSIGSDITKWCNSLGSLSIQREVSAFLTAAIKKFFPLNCLNGFEKIYIFVHSKCHQEKKI